MIDPNLNGSRTVTPIEEEPEIPPAMRGDNAAPLVVVDVETSGLDPHRHGLIEIGAVLLDQATLEPVGEFETAVRLPPPLEWDAGAERVHGVREAEARSADRPDEATALWMFLEWLRVEGGGCRLTLAGMNPAFDLSFLDWAAQRTGQDGALRARLAHRTLDLHTVAWIFARDAWDEVDRGRLHTDAIYWLLGIAPEPRPHRAITGARMEAAAFAELI